MLEIHPIQYRGFHNICGKDGTITGFEFRLRSTYYRGLWLSQIRPGRVIVDGEEILIDSGRITWCIGGMEYTPAQMSALDQVFWPVTECAVIRVKMPGGLSQGYHEIAIRSGYSVSYMPPDFDRFDDAQEIGGSFGANCARRTMLIV